MSKGALPGFRDFYPDEMAERTWIVETWRRVAARYALAEYDGPPLEPLDLYTRKSGDEIVGQLYAFTDKGGREVALRPEMTPTLARMVGARAAALRKPVRWFSIPQLFRYERQQKGRLREHFQLNVDIIGESDIAADAELIAIAVDMLRAFGLTSADVRARISDRRLLSAILAASGIAGDRFVAVYGVIDKLGREPADVSAGKMSAAAGSADAAGLLREILGVRGIAELRARPELAAAATEIARLEELFGYLDALGVADWVELDLSIVRGLAYYTGVVFELFDRKGEFRAICGGGRYDNLLGSLGGADLPALGFGMGDVVLAELLRARGLVPPPAAAVDVFVAASGETDRVACMQAAARLRAAGRRVEYSLKPQALSRQMKTAATAGAAEVVIVGAAGLTVKNMASGAERATTLEEYLGSIRTNG